MAEKEKEKKESERIKEELGINAETAWEKLEEGEQKKVWKLGDEYKQFLASAKTEREIVAWSIREIEKHGFKPLEKSNLKPGDKAWVHNKHKNLALLLMGKNGLENGLRVIVSHVDALRLDWKINPFYEDSGMALINLHYYGGIKKYHWVNTPLSLHGVVFLKDGKKLEINLGEKEEEPVFVISDLLPHVGIKAFLEKKASELIPGESLDAIGATIPLKEKDATEKIKLRLLKLLHEKYGLVEEDFFTAELQLLPAVKPKDIGFDGSLIGGYGHDDRACSFAGLKSILDVTGTPEHTCLLLFMDKEEIGSVGATGADSFFLENFVHELCTKLGTQKTAKKVLAEAYFISADVTAALDPKYKEFFDPANSSMVGYGVSIEKETGYGGKYDSSQASAEYMSFIRKLFNENKVVWQTGELGKVDEGGGGTVAKFFARYGCEIIDIGPPVLAMHSPFEVLSKVDLYQTYKAYKVFFESK
ncbi:aminopeptidase [Candidatus Micrarchaeota archaeon]|nr:aminopeptidase [Candidatus Micrarchaeota archaeon]MBU1930566.1 aminopeptidase [Candidatus Micrarchaeota archaeon]